MDVALTDGAECGNGGEGHVRLNFAMPRPLLVEAVTRMADAVAGRAVAAPAQAKCT